MPLQPDDHLRHAISGEFARESVAYCLLLPELGFMGHWYTWVDGESQAGFAMVLHRDGPDPVFFDHQTGIDATGQDFTDWRVGRVTLEVGEALRTATATYRGDDVEVEFSFEGMHDAFDYDSNGGGTASYLAQNRYEQGGRIVGTLRWGGKTLTFDGPATATILGAPATGTPSTTTSDRRRRGRRVHQSHVDTGPRRG